MTLLLNPLAQLLRGAAPLTRDRLTAKSCFFRKLFANETSCVIQLADKIELLGAVSWRTVTLLELWNCLLDVFLSDAGDKQHFSTVVREEVFGE